MPCHHCGKARHSVKDAAKALVKGDLKTAAEAATQAGEAIKAKLAGQDEGQKPTKAKL